MQLHRGVVVGTCSVVLLVASTFVEPAEGDELAERVPPALRPLGKPDKLHLVYFVPADREPTADYAAKIRVVMTFVADLYAADFAAHKLATTGLDFVVDGEAGEVAVELLRGQQPAAHYSGRPNYDFHTQWRTIIPEVEAAFGPAADQFYVVFAETYDTGPAPYEWPGGVALGGQISNRGAVGLFSAWILQDEFAATTVARQLELLADTTPIAGRVALGNGRPNSPRFEFIEDGFGAVAHEVGHGLGLPHDSRQDNRNIMGNGFRRLRENYLARRAPPPIGFSADHLRLLANSRWLAADPDYDDSSAPTATVEHATQLPPGADTCRLKIKIQDDRQLAALLLFSDTHGTVVGGAELTGGQATTEHQVRFPPLQKPLFQLTIKFIDRGGNISQAVVKIPVKPAAPADQDAPP